jgi:hypothetical protein
MTFDSSKAVNPVVAAVTRNHTTCLLPRLHLEPPARKDLPCYWQRWLDSRKRALKRAKRSADVSQVGVLKVRRTALGPPLSLSTSFSQQTTLLSSSHSQSHFLFSSSALHTFTG